MNDDILDFHRNELAPGLAHTCPVCGDVYHDDGPNAPQCGISFDSQDEDESELWCLKCESEELAHETFDYTGPEFGEYAGI